MAHINTLIAECGKQTNPTDAPAFQVPLAVEYGNPVELHKSFVPGSLLPLTRTQKIREHMTFRATGDLSYGVATWLMKAGFYPTGSTSSNPYRHTVDNLRTLLPLPNIPHVWLLGSEDIQGGTGPAVRIKDSYLQKIKLSSNINAPMVRVETDWFGTLATNLSTVTTEEFAGAALPTDLELVNGINAGFNMYTYTGAWHGGSSHSSLCQLIDWSIEMDTGLRPLWALDRFSYAMCGAKRLTPQITASFTIRAPTTSGAFTLPGRGVDGTPMELYWQIQGTNNRRLYLQMMGFFTETPSPHGRGEEDVIQAYKFMADTPDLATAEPKYFGFDVWSHWNYNGAIS